ncbi:MAG: amidohydrolase family protein [Sphingopyxis sp.]
MRGAWGIRRAAAAAAAGLLVCTAPAFAQNIAIINAKLVIGDGSAPIDHGTVIIRGGRVVAAGANVTAPQDIQHIDAAGRWVTPGIVAGFSRVGLNEVDAVDGSNDAASAASIYGAAIDIAPALNPYGTAIPVNRLNGVTRALVYPGAAASLFNGRGALVDLGGDAHMVTRAGLFQYVELGESGAARAGGSRQAAILHFRSLLMEAQDFGRNPSAYDGRSRDALLTRVDASALLHVLDGRDRLFIKVERASDILAVINLLREFPGIKPTLVGVTEGWTVAPQIAAAHIPVIASALNDLPDTFEQIAATQSNIGRMQMSGVQVAIGLVDDNETHKLGYARQYAGNLVALTRLPRGQGLSWDAAFAAITSGPAIAAGVDGEIGSLLVGRVGDVIIWDGDPLELSSAPTAVYVDGIAQEMESRQTHLRDRYLNPVEGALPNAYDY